MRSSRLEFPWSRPLLPRTKGPVFKRQLVESLLAESKAAVPKECCGLLWTREKGLFCDFTGYSKHGTREAFVLPDSWILKQVYEKKNHGLRLSGFYHSHPNTGSTLPSRRDLLGHPPGAYFVIVSPGFEDAKLFQRHLDEYDYSELPLNVSE